MKNIELPEQLIRIAKRDWFRYGTESYIYKVDSNSIYKIFKTDKQEILENKLMKLIKLNKLKIEFLTNPIVTLSYKGQFIGYEMNYNEDDIQWFNTVLTLEEKKEYLKSLKEKLLVLEEYGILYPDIKDDNLLINRKTGKLNFCDIDNVQIDGLRVDVVQYISNYLRKENSLFDSGIHAFMHNLYTLEQLEEIHINDFIDFIELERTEPFKSFNENQKKILKNMVLLNEKRIRNGYLIDNLR